MKLKLFIFLVFLNQISFHSQDSVFFKKTSLKNNTFEVNLTQNTASLFTPSFSNIHPGINTIFSRPWNKNEKLQGEVRLELDKKVSALKGHKDEIQDSMQKIEELQNWYW